MTSAVDKFHEFDRFGSVLGLERVGELLSRLGNPHLTMKYIHVAGTNGKGSTCKFLEKGLAACGYKVGLYTSPYIEKFNERIQFDGEMITDEELEIYGDQALAKAKEMVDDGLTSPTEFEVVMATAFLYFRAKKPDIIILEAGMGGLGDATNIIPKPLVSVFTSVAYDHMHVLGNTLEEIAADKAGIIKPGCPVVSNVAEHGPAAVIARKAYAMGSRLYDVSKVKYTIDWENPFNQQVSMELWETDYSEVVTSMVGRHQAENLKTALAVLELLRKNRTIRVERSALYRGLKEAVQPGRFEVLSEGTPNIVIDGAHNDAGAEALAKTMKECYPEAKTLIVTGMVERKETVKVMKHFLEIGSGFFITKPDYEDRAMATGELEKCLREAAEESGRELNIVGSNESVYDSVNDALKTGEDYDVVLFAGSLYLIGAVRSVIKGRTDYDRDRTLKYS